MLHLLVANLRDHRGDDVPSVNLRSVPSFPADSDLREVFAKGLGKRSGTAQGRSLVLA